MVACATAVKFKGVDPKFSINHIAPHIVLELSSNENGNLALEELPLSRVGDPGCLILGGALAVGRQTTSGGRADNVLDARQASSRIHSITAVESRVNSHATRV